MSDEDAQDSLVLDELYRLISKSNVVELRGCTPKYRLPESLTSISISHEYDEPFSMANLPQNLKQLKIGASFDQPIDAASLPKTLKTLRFGNVQSDELAIDLLPRSLKSFNAESLPPNLEVLDFINPWSAPDTGKVKLPSSLRTVIFPPLAWLPSVVSLSNLTSLIVGQATSFEYGMLDLSTLPASLTELCVLTPIMLQSSMPTSIKQLNIIKTRHDINETFYDRSRYQIERIAVDAISMELLDGLKIKKLICIFFPLFDIPGERSYLRKIPIGVETLQIGNYSKTISHRYPIPPTIIFDYEFMVAKFGEIPNTVEEVVITNYSDQRKPFNLDSLPPTVRSLTIPLKAIQVGKKGFPKTIYNLCIVTLSMNKNKLFLRKLDDDHYLLFGQTHELNTGIININNIDKFFSNLLECLQDDI
ncbi:hypothetical protein PPL_08440 [Heterostelium album PN500]|uniref:Uncharacterized protein n=1 Tax=Heterostelium pallidum (strain ATCC 26659 / Pp 5 / PN500) TaxID=670386 RepID=D3BI72_HETP5|nr:hypothetical protein PPL_08440 [Heterostelium album PN500]EFA78972.1 hypothetical protein PPL_08440 [Heterostelium album PN500]|eukprot:XP_020431096.1 hypothetical protein PPL_08440 [Heterostelium album PN500]